MAISSIEFDGFRNLKKNKIKFENKIVLLSGNNGSGKSNFLELCFLVTRGKSNRTNQLDKVINLSAEKFLLFTIFNENKFRLGIEKKRKEKIKIHFNENPVNSLIDFSHEIHSQIISPDAHLLIDSNPKIRRHFIDWLLFHVKPNLIKDWKNWKRILDNRNIALKSKLSLNEIKIWDKQLIQITEHLSQHRKVQLELINKEFNILWKSVVGNKKDSIFLEYQMGWPKGMPFSNSLEHSFKKDFRRGFTHVGLNRSDFKIVNKNESDIKYEIKDYYSKGNKKLVAFLLYLSQVICLIKQISNKDKNKIVLMLDDLAAELDARTLKKLLSILIELDVQIIITSIQKDVLVFTDFFDTEKLSYDMFHVEQGKIEKQN